MQAPGISEQISRPNFSNSTLKGYRWEALAAQPPVPPDNPQTPEKVALGQKLFFDKQLSWDRTVSCATCHILNKEKAGADGLPLSTGIDNQTGERNAPTVINAAFQRVFFWDGRADSLEAQALGPITNPLEMGLPSLQLLEERLSQDSEYPVLFRQVFPDSPAVSVKNIVRAIASFERSLITPNSPYDRFVQGDREALTEIQQEGMVLFESIGCVQCHSGPNFSGASFDSENAAFRQFPVYPDHPLSKKYKLANDSGAAISHSALNSGIWRIPSLRNVSLTAPYFHNGSVESLREAVIIMARLQLGLDSDVTDDNKAGTLWSESRQQFIHTRSRKLTARNIDAIVAFLESLEGLLPYSPYYD